MRYTQQSALALAAALALLAGNAGAGSARRAENVFIRLNQVGYLAGDSKVAFLLSNESMAKRTFVVRDEANAAVFSGTIGAERGAYGAFAHLYEADFSALRAPGVYRVALDDAVSPPFTIGQGSYSRLIATSLQFFRVQRCGDTNPTLHGKCHLTDGVASGGPADGKRVDVAGGWHDAGDYLKFLITHGYATVLLLSAYQRHPAAFAGDARVPAVLEEARVGLDWMVKLWDPGRQVLYFQVGDARDHDVWRMPEGDDAAGRPRRALACASGLGANVAGKAAAALALAAFLWGDRSAAFSDPALAERYRTLAEQIYRYGKRRPAAQPSTDGFYAEASWVDDMTLAAAELYRATGKARYLADARTFAKRSGSARGFDWRQVHALAHYELARVDASYVPRAARLLADDLAAARSHAGANQFGAAVDRFGWGSAENMSGVALEALWYEDLTGDSAYRDLARAQRDYELGMNPWGVCFVNGAGTTWPKAPHHQIADITRSELVGFWNEGPVRPSVFQGQKITLREPDEYAAFQGSEAVYHDDVADYVTNEPTITANAAGIAMVSWYAEN
jgi:endoglucanase